MLRTEKLFISAAAACLMAMLALNAQAAGMSAQEFVQKAAVGNEFEISSSKLAQDKSQSAEVKRFAGMMISDHTNNLTTLKATARTATPTVSVPVELDAAHQKKFDELMGLSSDAFDNRYIAMQREAHDAAVKLYTEYSQYGDNAALKAFAKESLATLKAHQEHVNDITK